MNRTQPLLIDCKNLEIGYRGKAIVPPISLTIGAGEFWVILGRNGSGKTTFLRTLLNFIPPIAGKVYRKNEKMRFSYVSQRSSFNTQFPVVARDVVRQGCERSFSFLSLRMKTESVVQKALEKVHALDLADQHFFSLSEGQKQRILLARLIVSKPDIALLDEPTAAMDAAAQKEAFTSLNSFRKECNCSVVVVSHYREVAREYADFIVFLDSETQNILVGAPQEIFSHDLFQALYGRLADCGEENV